MSSAYAENVAIRVNGAHVVSGLLEAPPRARACYVLAHGAGAGMFHPFMAEVAAGLGERGIATLRYQFPFMERGSKRTDAPGLAHATVRAAVARAVELVPELPLVAGGKSFGGRMTSQAQAAQPLAEVRGIIFVGFPLHAPGKPSVLRASHLADVDLPMLFLQGTRDELADLDLVRQTTAKLGRRATLHIVEGADHSFHVLVRSGRNDAQVRDELLDVMAGWMKAHRDRA
jgi:uncharacterized protein